MQAVQAPPRRGSCWLLVWCCSSSDGCRRLCGSAREMDGWMGVEQAHGEGCCGWPCAPTPMTKGSSSRACHFCRQGKCDCDSKRVTHARPWLALVLPTLICLGPRPANVRLQTCRASFQLLARAALPVAACLRLALIIPDAPPHLPADLPCTPPVSRLHPSLTPRLVPVPSQSRPLPPHRDAAPACADILRRRLMHL